jgi:hypothetical protein
MDSNERNGKANEIKKITVDYHRLAKIKPEKGSEGAASDYIIWEYTEQLTIDRETETLELVQDIGPHRKATHRYKVGDDIESLLHCFHPEYLFSHIEGNPDEVIDTPDETKNYLITIEYTNDQLRFITGSFDKYGLPDDFAYFAETVIDFIGFYGFGEILRPSVYRKVKRRKSDYIYCSVTFDEGYNIYYYLTDDESIEVGDLVLVPAGIHNREVVVEVVDIEYFSEENVPLPLEKTKRIIRKITHEEPGPPEQ